MQDDGAGVTSVLVGKMNHGNGTPGRGRLKENEKMWVIATLCLILFLVISLQAGIIIPYFAYQLPYHSTTSKLKELVQLLIPFNIGAALILINYYNCVTLDAGGVPLGWQPPLRVSTNQTEISRYCRTCKAMKPPRAHHCRTCKRCILRMDHHCPWIANCVGQRNYASFIRFLAAVDVTCAGHLILCTLRTLDYWWTRQGGMWRSPSTLTMVLLILNFCLCLPTFLLVGSFSIYHFWCLCTNSTTIEGWEKDKVETMIQKGRIDEVDFPFDLGMLSNIQAVLGKSPLQWCIPSLTQGDGLQYRVNKDVEPIEQYHWPPKDPSRENREKKRKAVKMPLSGPFTYGNNGFNPALVPSNSLRARKQMTTHPPWHPDFDRLQAEEELEVDDVDAAQASGVDRGDSCVPPGTIPGSKLAFAEGDDDESRSENSNTSEEEETHRTMTKSRVRRGSEGYEVRPKRYEVAYAAWEDNGQDGQAANNYDDGDDDDDDDEKNHYGFDEYDNEEEQDKEWDWQRRQEEEDKLRRMLEEEMRLTGTVTSHDPPPDWHINVNDDDESTTTTTKSPSSVLLPSQVMRRRSQWQQFIADQQQ